MTVPAPARNAIRGRDIAETREPRSWRPDGTALAILTAMTAIVAWNRLTFDSWLTRFDLFTFFLPWYTFLGERLRAFDIPGWNPHLFSGAPFAGDPESGWMYLPAMLFFALLPTLAAFKGMVAFHLAIAAFSTYAFARVLGMGAVPSLTAAVVFLVGPFLQWNTHCCLIFAQFAAWIPLALLGVELAMRAPSWRDRLIPWFVGGFAISQMLGGWIGEGWLYAMLLPAAYIGYRALLSPPRSGLNLRRRLSDGITTGIGVLGSGLALAAAGILPRLTVNAETNLAGGDYAALGAAGVLNSPWGLDYLLAQTLGVGSGYHFRAASFGGAAVVLSLLALPMARRRFGVPFFAVLTLVVLILTLETTPIHQLFYLIPRFRQFHDHDAWRVIALAAIGPAMLSGATIASLPDWRGRRELLPVIFLPLLLMLAVDLALRRTGMSLGWQPIAAAMLTTLLIALAVAIPTGGRGPATSLLPDRTHNPVSSRGNEQRELVTQPRPSAAHRDSSQSLGTTLTANDALTRFVPALALAVIFLLPTGLELTGSWLGWPPNRTWERHWRADPDEAAALVEDVRQSDLGGAGRFLQGELADSGPVRYAGYGGFGYPGDDARADSYMARRFDPAVQALLVNGRPIYLDLFDIQGYNPLHLARYDEFMTALNGAPQDYHTALLLPSGLDSPLLDLLAVRYVTVDASLPRRRDDLITLRSHAQPVFRTPQVTVYERATDLPHAWIVHDVRAVNRGDALPMLTSGTIDPYRTALVEGTPPETAPVADSANESARVTAYEPDSITIATQAASPGLLVVSEIYESGWRAFVDGREVAVLPTDHVLRGVPLPAGEHTVVLRYDPLSLRVGVGISGITLVVMLMTFMAAGWSSMRREAGVRMQPG
ncbi:MAG: YfhO family protein [Thermomicrobiales bacterium]